ncbi:hypothetical protein P3T21_007254 [Paraburkholderia sp. GAS334]
MFLSSLCAILEHFSLKRHLSRASLYRKELAARFVVRQRFTEFAQDSPAV